MSSSESDQEAVQNTNTIRSSVRSASEDVPVPPLRRVSFASNITVKPFVNDVDRTIWDNTYEEEVNSASCLNNLDSTKMTANLSFTCCNFSNTGDQENISPTANRTTLEPCDMELTSQFNDEDSEERMDIDVANANQTMFPLDDMTLTCTFPEVNVLSTSMTETVVDSTEALIKAATSSVANNNSMDQLMESMNRILGNYQLITYQPVTVDLTKCHTTIKNSQEVLKKAKECIANYQPQPTEFRLSCQSLTSTSSESESETNTLTSTDSSDSVQCLDSEIDEAVELSKPLMDQIREVFDKSEPSNIKLIEIEEKTIFFTSFSQSVWFRADLHEENDNVIELTSLQVLNETSENPHHSLCKFLVEHLMSKTQMDQLTSSLGQSFNMLSFLEYLQMIVDKYYDFFWTFVMLKR